MTSRWGDRITSPHCLPFAITDLLTSSPHTGMNATVARLEQLLEDRTGMIEQYASLWAVHGGGSGTWEDHLVDLDTADLKETLRARLARDGRDVKVTELKDALLREPAYRARVHETIEGRTQWARVRERWSTLEWRIQLEMAKLRLELGEDATPTDAAFVTTSDAED